MKMNKQGGEDGRKNNKGVIKPVEEKKVPIAVYVKARNREAIKAKIEALAKKLDK